MQGLAFGFVANHFEIVSVRVKDESGIIVRMIVRSQARGAIVFATRGWSRAVESVELLADIVLRLKDEQVGFENCLPAVVGALGISRAEALKVILSSPPGRMFRAFTTKSWTPSETPWMNRDFGNPIAPRTREPPT
jgi:hypothetical protein